MEQTTSKTTANILIVLAIVLIGGSMATTLLKKETPAQQKPQENIVETPKVQEIVQVATTTTPTATSTITLSPDFITTVVSKKWTWVKNMSPNGNVSVTPKKIDAFSVTLKEDGTLQGTTDCNTFFGTFTANTNTISFTNIGASMMYCEGSQESIFIQAIQSVIGYTFSTSTKELSLITASGTMQFK